jgi:hypothetical protein
MHSRYIDFGHFLQAITESTVRKNMGVPPTLPYPAATAVDDVCATPANILAYLAAPCHMKPKDPDNKTAVPAAGAVASTLRT